MTSKPAYEQVILITGARDWKDTELIAKTLTSYKDRNVLLFHGDCQGADKMAGNIASKLKFTVEVSPAEWAKYGRAAGPVRNKMMVKKALECKQRGIPVTVLAFHDALEKSRGTKHCAAEARKNGLELVIIKH